MTPMQFNKNSLLSANFAQRIQKRLPRNYRKTVAPKMMTQNVFKTSRLNLLAKDETLVLKLEIYPAKSKFMNYKVVLNSSDIKSLFDLEEFIKTSYKEPVSMALASRIRTSNPKIHIINLCHYLTSKIHIKKTTLYKQVFFDRIHLKT